MEAAKKLEDALKNDRRENAGHDLTSFIDALDTVLFSLSSLPSPDEDASVQGRKSTASDAGDLGREDAAQVLIGQLGTEVENPIQVLIDRLNNGELAAEEQFAEVNHLLAGSGFDEHLQTIAALIDDIEYEKAAKMAGSLLTMVQRERGN